MISSSGASYVRPHSLWGRLAMWGRQTRPLWPVPVWVLPGLLQTLPIRFLKTQSLCFATVQEICLPWLLGWLWGRGWLSDTLISEFFWELHVFSFSCTPVTLP